MWLIWMMWCRQRRPCGDGTSQQGMGKIGLWGGGGSFQPPKGGGAGVWGKGSCDRPVPKRLVELTNCATKWPGRFFFQKKFPP